MLNKGIEEHDEGVISLAQRTMFRNFLHLLEKDYVEPMDSSDLSDEANKSYEHYE